MMPSNGNPHQKISDTKVGAKVLVSPLLYANNDNHFMFLHKKIYLSNLPLPKHTLLLVTSIQCITN